MKNIILLSDGTGNSGGKKYNTNVWNLYTAIDRHSHENSCRDSSLSKDESVDRQIAFYDDGVGTNKRKIVKFLGSIVGFGLKRNIRELYTFLVNNYEQGDKIYLFGFSRGAYTVRVLARLITHQGILDRKDYETNYQLEKEIHKLYDDMRMEFFRACSATLWVRKILCILWSLLKPLVCGFEYIFHIFHYFLVFVWVKHLVKDVSSMKEPNKIAFYECVAQALQLPKKILDCFSLNTSKEVSLTVDDIDRKSRFIDKSKKIEFIGIWDTVGAYAIPIKSLSNFVNRNIYCFTSQDRTLPCEVRKACHALSIDDERAVFHPTLWNEDQSHISDCSADGDAKTSGVFENDQDESGNCRECHNVTGNHERIEQVWFTGAHANVGGGYPKQGLAWESLNWMMAKAKKRGLYFAKDDHEKYGENRDCNDKLYDPLSGFGAYYGYQQRNIQAIWEENNGRKEGTKARIHISTFQRIASRTHGYAPGNLPSRFEIVGIEHLNAKQQKNIDDFAGKIGKNLKEKAFTKCHARAKRFREWTTYMVVTAALSILVLFFCLNSVLSFTYAAVISLAVLIMLTTWIWHIARKLRHHMNDTYEKFWDASLKNENDGWSAINIKQDTD